MFLELPFLKLEALLLLKMYEKVRGRYRRTLTEQGECSGRKRDSSRCGKSSVAPNVGNIRITRLFFLWSSAVSASYLWGSPPAPLLCNSSLWRWAGCRFGRWRWSPVWPAPPPGFQRSRWLRPPTAQSKKDKRVVVFFFQTWFCFKGQRYFTPLGASMAPVFDKRRQQQSTKI